MNKYKILIVLLLLISKITANQTTDIKNLLQKLTPTSQENLCKNIVKTNKEYIQCLQIKIKENPSIENINFLAGVYAVKREYKNAIETYEINVKKGDKKATYYLAGIYNEALKQHDKALPYFEKIKQYKDSTCQIGGIKAIVKDDSWFEFLDKRKAKKRTLQYYDDEIKKGNLKAYGCKGLYYNSLEEYEEAEKMFLKGLEKGEKENLFFLGNFYSHYIYNIPTAISYYEKSYKVGNMQAANNLGFIHFERGRYTQAIKWLILSSNSGDKQSLLGLGLSLVATGKIELAFKVYEKMGELGDERGYSSVGFYYAREKKYDKAIEYFTKCYKKGYKECARGNGRVYDDDLKEYDKAKQWYIKAYEMGDSESAYVLAFLYHLELKEFDKAIEWYTKASDMGYINAMNNLGVLYEKDLKDKKTAIKWYKKAAKNGNMKSKNKLEKLGVLK